MHAAPHADPRDATPVQILSAQRPGRRAARADPRDAPPLQILSAERPVRRAPGALLAELGRHLEEQARAMGPSAVLVGAFAHDERFEAGTRERYADLARSVAFCGAVGPG